MNARTTASRRSPSSLRVQAAGRGLASLLILGGLINAGANQAKPNPPKVTTNGA